MSEEVRQKPLLELPPDWEEHWKGMPEFVQEDMEPFKSIQVHFETKKDMLAFAKLVGQNITVATRFIWFPKAEITSIMGKKYVDGEPK